jgi:hypothetical protein
MAKQFYHAAIDAESVQTNPFAKLKAAVRGNVNRQRFVNQKTIDKCLGHRPDTDWRCIIVLSRYAGLQCPSELLGLYPAKDVASWLGNRVPVAMAHYAMTRDESFAKAALRLRRPLYVVRFRPKRTRMRTNQERSRAIRTTQAATRDKKNRLKTP